MLLNEAEQVNVDIRLNSEVSQIVPDTGGFRVAVAAGKPAEASARYAVSAPKVVLASGG